MLGAVGKTAILLGLGLILFGVLWEVGGRYLPLGRLPGDLLWKRGNFQIYFPLATSLLLSALLSLAAYLFRR